MSRSSGSTDLRLQGISILLAAIRPYTKLRLLDLSWNYDLGLVEPNLLNRAAGWLEELNISNVQMPKPQVHRLFGAYGAIARPTNLKTLKIGTDFMPTFFGWSIESAFSKKVKIMKKDLEVVWGKEVLSIMPLNILYKALGFNYFTINIEATRLTMN